MDGTSQQLIQQLSSLHVVCVACRDGWLHEAVFAVLAQHRRSSMSHSASPVAVSPACS